MRSPPVFASLTAKDASRKVAAVLTSGGALLLEGIIASYFDSLFSSLKVLYCCLILFCWSFSHFFKFCIFSLIQIILCRDRFRVELSGRTVAVDVSELDLSHAIAEVALNLDLEGEVVADGLTGILDVVLLKVLDDVVWDLLEA
jgi:hypothetical protein